MAPIPRILLVDDSEETVEGLKSFLEQRFEVFTACNGLDALKAFEDLGKQFDLVITDLVMPTISGYGLISLLKQKSPQTPVIAMTGWGQHPLELAAEAKADIVLRKPFELVEFDQSVSKALTGSLPTNKP